MYYIYKERALSVLRVKEGVSMVGWSVSFTGLYLFCLFCQPALELNVWNCYFSAFLKNHPPPEWFWKQIASAFSSQRPLSPPSPLEWSYSQGILGFVDHNRDICPLGTMLQRKEDYYHNTGGLLHPWSSPLHPHLFVYNKAKRLCSSKAWCIHTVPFFITG